MVIGQTLAGVGRAILGTLGTGLSWTAFFVVVAGGVLIWLGANENRFATLRPAVALPLLLLVGVGSLLLLITVMVTVLDGLGLTDKRHAFGLPDGSMQAIIALSLILDLHHLFPLSLQLASDQCRNGG